MTLPLPLRLRLRALFRAVTVSLLRCCCRRCFSCVCVGVRDCCCCYLWELAGLAAPQLTNTFAFVVRAHTHAHIYVHIQGEKTHALLECSFVSTPWFVCECTYVFLLCMCAMYLMNQQQKMGATFSVFTRPQLMSAFLVVGRCHTHTCKFQHTHAHAHKLTPAALSILTFERFHFSVRACDVQIPQLVCLAFLISLLYLFFTLRIYLYK